MERSIMMPSCHQQCQAIVKRTGKPCLRETKKDGLWYCGYHRGAHSGAPSAPPLLECSICMNEITKNEKMVTTPCKHVFHKRCLDKWRERSGTAAPTCPNCRAVIGKAPRYLYQEREWFTEERQKIERKQRRLCGRMRVLGMQLECPEDFEEQWDAETLHEMRKKMDEYERQAEALQEDMRALRNALSIIRDNRLRRQQEEQGQ